MATRFYFARNTTALITPAFGAGWNLTTGALRQQMATSKFGEAMANVQRAGTGVTLQNRLINQWVGPPMLAQTISGNVKGQFRAIENGTSNDYYAQMRIAVVSNDGSTERGELLALHSNGLSSEFATTPTNRKFPLAALSPAALSDVVAQLNDRIIVEVGYRQIGAVAANGGMSVGSDSATDLAENETETAANSPWIEFSGTIAFPSMGIGISWGDLHAALLAAYNLNEPTFNGALIAAACAETGTSIFTPGAAAIALAKGVHGVDCTASEALSLLLSRGV